MTQKGGAAGGTPNIRGDIDNALGRTGSGSLSMGRPMGKVVGSSKFSGSMGRGLGVQLWQTKKVAYAPMR